MPQQTFQRMITPSLLAVLNWALSTFGAGFPHPGPQGEREKVKVKTSLARYPILLLSSSPFL